MDIGWVVVFISGTLAAGAFGGARLVASGGGFTAYCGSFTGSCAAENVPGVRSAF